MWGEEPLAWVSWVPDEVTEATFFVPPDPAPGHHDCTRNKHLTKCFVQTEKSTEEGLRMVVTAEWIFSVVVVGGGWETLGVCVAWDSSGTF